MSWHVNTQLKIPELISRAAVDKGHNKENQKDWTGCSSPGSPLQSSQAESAHADNVGNGVSGRVRPDETHHTDRYRRHTGPFCRKISFFPAGSHECRGWIQIRFSALYQRVAHQVVRGRGGGGSGELVVGGGWSTQPRPSTLIQFTASPSKR